MTIWQRGIDICIVRTVSPEIVEGSLIPFEFSNCKPKSSSTPMVKVYMDGNPNHI